MAEAVEILGLSEDAVRARLRRGTLTRVDMSDGRVLVDLSVPDGQPTANPTTSNQQQTATDQPADSALIEALNAHINTLQDQVEALNARLDREQQANAENRRIIAGLTNRLPELEAAPEQRDAPPDASEPRSGTPMPHDQDGPQERRSWWRQFFGIE